MLFLHDVAVRPQFSVRTLDCHLDGRSWSPLKRAESHELVLLRRGRFRRRADGVVSDVDTTMAFMSTPGIEEQFAHTTGDGDVCTVIVVDADLWHAHPQLTPVYVDARLDLLHRSMLAAPDVDFSLAEQLVNLLTVVFGQSFAGSPADTAAVAAAREAIAARHPAAKGLFTLAKALDISPYRLSRAFSPRAWCDPEPVPQSSTHSAGPRPDRAR